MSGSPHLLSVPASSLGFTATGRESMSSGKVVRIAGGLTTSTPTGPADHKASTAKSRLVEAARIVEVLQSNRNLLSQNIVLSEDFFCYLKDHKVIPGPMIADIKTLEDREEANIMMMQYVGRLGPGVFHRFCDILGLTGHTFLAEHIRTEAEQPDSSNRTELYEEVFKKYPAILKVLAPGEQRGLTNYIRDKVTDGIIKSQWKARSTGDGKIADERNKKVTDSIMKDRVIKEKDVEIIKLTRLLEDERTEHRKCQETVSELENRCHDIQVRYNEQLTIMMNSYQASERANWEIEQRLAVFDRQIKAMNAKIQIYFGGDEYSAQADASNVKVSKLEENVMTILNQLADLEKENKQLIAWYEEQRRRLFEALGLDDTGQDLRTAYLNAQEKINSEVRRLTAEVDLLSMTFDMSSIWSVLEADRERREEEKGGKKKVKGTSEAKTDVNVLKTAAAKSKDMAANFDYGSVLHMVKDRLHEVHMEIEKLKRKNLAYERKIGKLEGELDLIKMKGFMDDPSQVDRVTPTPRAAKPTDTNQKGGRRLGNASKSPAPLTSRTPRTNRPTGRKEEINKNPPLPPIFGSLKRDTPLSEAERDRQTESNAPSESAPESETKSTKLRVDMPTVNEDEPSAAPGLKREPTNMMINLPDDDTIQLGFGQRRETSIAAESAKKASQKLDPGKSYEAFAKNKQPADSSSSLADGKPVLGLTETQAKAKMKHAEQDVANNQYKQPELKRMDFQAALPQLGGKPK